MEQMAVVAAVRRGEKAETEGIMLRVTELAAAKQERLVHLVLY